MGWDLNWYKWGSLSSLCYPVQHRARSTETGGDNQGWDEVQPCHPAAVLWWGASCKGPTAALSVDCAGHLQASAILWFNPSSWSTQDKGFWMPGWQEECWVSGGMCCEQLCVVPMCVLTGHWQYQPPVGEASLVSAVFLCLAMPTQLLGSVLAPWGLGWALWDKKQQVQNKVLFTCPRLVFVPRVNEVGTVWMLPASKQTNQTKQTSYEVVLGRAAHQVPGNKPVPPSCQWDADSSVQPERGFSCLLWLPGSPGSPPLPQPSISPWQQSMGLSHRPVIYMVWNSPPSEIEMTPRSATSNIKPRALLPYLLVFWSFLHLFPLRRSDESYTERQKKLSLGTLHHHIYMLMFHIMFNIDIINPSWLGSVRYDM